MKAELQRFQILFEKADVLLGIAVKPTRLRYGVTDEQLEKAFEEVLQEPLNNAKASRAGKGKSTELEFKPNDVKRVEQARLLLFI
jgi:hypothetical protein